jgi:hypothetical protein
MYVCMYVYECIYARKYPSMCECMYLCAMYTCECISAFMHYIRKHIVKCLHVCIQVYYEGNQKSE